VNNCDRVFHLEVCSRDFVNGAKSIISRVSTVILQFRKKLQNNGNIFCFFIFSLTNQQVHNVSKQLSVSCVELQLNIHGHQLESSRN